MNARKAGTRFLAFLLALVMVIGLMPMGVFATEAETTAPVVTEETQATQPVVETTAPQEETPETSVPATEIPETTVPETEVTETTVPETEVPETTVPETEAPEVTVPQATLPVAPIDVEQADVQPQATSTTPGNTDNTVEYIMLGSDRHGQTEIVPALLTMMEEVIAGDNMIDYVGLLGDMVNSTNAYDTADLLEEVNKVEGHLTYNEVDIVYAAHDKGTVTDANGMLNKTSGLWYTDADGHSDFYVYGIIQDDVSSTGNATTAAAAFTNWVNGLDANDNRVIIVASHFPLHDKRGDNKGGYIWHQALNAAAGATIDDDGNVTVSRNILFFHGHNHTEDSTEYYVPVGDKMDIENNGSTASQQQLYYTYATAGYMLNDDNTGAEGGNGHATLLTITADKIGLARYDYADGLIESESEYAYSTDGGTAYVSRVVNRTLTSIAVSGDTEYTVGGNGLNLTVTATYDDGTTADVTADSTFSGYDLTASGNYTVTAAYEDKTATIDVKVYLYDEDDYNLISVEAFSQGATGLTVTWDDEADEVVENASIFTDYVVYDLALTNPGESTEYAMSIVEDMDTTNLAVYHVAEDGTLTQIEYEIVNDSVVFTTNLTGTFAYGSITVPEGYTLSSLTMEGIPYDVFVGTSVDVTEATITATYVKEGAEDFVRVLTTYDYEETNFSGFDVNTIGKQTVTFTFDGMTATAPINVWGETFSDETSGITVKVGEGDYGVTAVTVADSENTNVAAAIANVISGDSYKAYDISLVFDTGYSETTATKTVTLPIPEGVTNPAVYYVSATGSVVTPMETTVNEDGTVSFTTTHFSTYVVGESTEITVPENETASGSTTTGGTETKTIYKLVSSLTAGEEYLIVSSNSAGSAYGLAGSTTGASVTIEAADTVSSVVYIEDKGDALEWTASSGWKFASGDYDLGISNTDLSFSDSDSWTLGTNALTQSIKDGKKNRTYYLCCNDGTWSASTSSDNVYFYQKTEIEVDTTTTVSGTYKITGKDISAVVAADGSTTANLTSTLTFVVDENYDADDVVTDVSTTATYEIVTVDANGNTVDGDPNDIITKIENGVVYFSGSYGTALVKVSYDTNGDTDGGVVTDYITVTATAPYYTIQLHKANLTEVTITEFKEGVNYYTYNSTTSNYQLATEYVEGTTYYTTPVIQGDEITSTIALKGIEAGDTYSVWAVVKEVTSTGTTDLGKLGDALTWTVSDTSIATIDTSTGVITFTGTNYGTFTVTVAYEGADGKVITDTITISATESLYVVPGDGTDDFPEYPNQGAVRFDKTATAVGNFSKTGIAKVEISMTGVPYSTGKTLDVLLMLDMSTSMDTKVADGVDRVDVTITAAKAFAKTILVNDDGTFTGNYIAIKYFNGSSVYTTTDWMTVTSESELEALYDLIEALYTPTSSGTYYSVAMEDCYDTIIARDKVGDNTQALVFMSDGGPTYYTYVDSSATNGYSTVSNSPATIVGWFDVDDNDTSDDETDDTATPNSSFKQEYYSTQLKAAGYPVYTVGLGLSNNDTGPSAFTGLTSGAHEAITSYILAQMATNSSYFYNIADSDAVSSIGNVFSAIAASIKEAATDVTVEDKIGSNYTVNFSLPNGITSDATDGVEDFYIQVVDYVLDTTTHERTGSYTVLENFTFDGETGALVSHTVDGVTCSDCAHVTITDGVVTKIDGTYFDYEVKDDGEYLTWKAAKLSSTELALQYFAYLDNSAGTAVENQVPAGTYYTNEYATLTYTNVNNKVVQQEFPIPQMTWNGAQVSYVFYLVNDAGQPVNRAGKVIPFAEAIYVTDVYTYSVIWNDLEQSAGLEAEYLASDKLPDAYELYDDDASYNIHVYEKETEVNLNNHFVIGGNVTDDYNTVTNSWTNAKTTYVFNNKSDTTKYNTVGAYAADDGDADANETGLSYFCKSAAIEGATYTTSVENDVTVYTVTSVGNGYQAVTGETQATVANITAAGGSITGGTIIGDYIYYVDENGAVYTIVTKSDGIEVDKGFDFANTTVAFAVVWKPELAPDTVVVDYGLDVVIDVIKNDNMAAGVVGVRTDAPSDVTINSGNYTAAKATSVDVKIGDLVIGTATVENLTSVRFSLNKTNGMQFTEPAEFYYETGVNYYDNSELKTTSMYSKVTVIPAATVYYEDEYVELKTYNKTDSESSYLEVASDAEFDSNLVYYTLENGTYTKAKNITEFADDVTYYVQFVAKSGWDQNSVSASATQDVDRPGIDKIGDGYDADNPYGYDSAYESMSTYSMGNAAKTHVDTGKYATATFSFYGTGFDIISLTSNTTGTITVEVAGPESKKMIVDTYYGYSRNDDGKWVVTTNDPNAIYQVPVIKVQDMAYGKYTVTITCTYMSFLDHNESVAGYDFYLDAIRIYDPVAPETVVGKDGEGDDAKIEDIYSADGEGWPEYQELRNNIIKGTHYTVTENEDGTVKVTVAEGEDNIGGAIFLDGVKANTSIADYVSYGPNNELYLAPGQAIAFNVNIPSNVADIQLGMKMANGASVTYSIIGSTGTYTASSVDTYTLKSTTDMYYSILDYAKNGTVVIMNTSDETTGGILSLTNIKVTHTSEPDASASDASTANLLWMDADSVAYALEVTNAKTELSDALAQVNADDSGNVVTASGEADRRAEGPEEEGVQETVVETTAPAAVPVDGQTEVSQEEQPASEPAVTEAAAETETPAEPETPVESEAPAETEDTEKSEENKVYKGASKSGEAVRYGAETPEEDEPVTFADRIANFISKFTTMLGDLFGKWFR